MNPPPSGKKDLKQIIRPLLDALDPAVMTGVIGRTAGGMSYWQVAELVAGVARAAQEAGADALVRPAFEFLRAGHQDGLDGHGMDAQRRRLVERDVLPLGAPVQPHLPAARPDVADVERLEELEARRGNLVGRRVEHAHMGLDRRQEDRLQDLLGLEVMAEDEYLEVTPKSVRLRKQPKEKRR